MRQAVTIASEASVDARGSFIAKTYLHLLGAIGAFVAIEFALLKFPYEAVGLPVIPLLVAQFAFSGWSWLLFLGGFIFVSWIAQSWAAKSTSMSMQYAGLSLFVVAESILFLPLLFVAAVYGGPEVIPTAGIITLVLFACLTGVVFITRRDFSWLRGVLWVAVIAAMGVILCSILFGFSLGIVFSGVMLAVAAGYVLYDTSNVLHHYRTDQHVAASLALFASIALMFWYVLRILMSRD